VQAVYFGGSLRATMPAIGKEHGDTIADSGGRVEEVAAAI
jgi:hypothetical protein